MTTKLSRRRTTKAAEMKKAKKELTQAKKEKDETERAMVAKLGSKKDTLVLQVSKFKSCGGCGQKRSSGSKGDDHYVKNKLSLQLLGSGALACRHGFDMICAYSPCAGMHD